MCARASVYVDKANYVRCLVYWNCSTASAAAAAVARPPTTILLPFHSLFQRYILYAKNKI